LGKNLSAKECDACGNLIYYGGNCNCMVDAYKEPSDEEIRAWVKETDEVLRPQAEQYILNKYNDMKQRNEVQNIWNAFEFHSAIWYSSVEILPNLEVQVVIDSEDSCFVTTGSAGYVEFGMQPPIGMKLPIKCWIHTHPFGSAYFSGTDISTVSIWDTTMQNAIVLGGYNHWGSWVQERPKELMIYRNGREERLQKWGDEEE